MRARWHKYPMNGASSIKLFTVVVVVTCCGGCASTTYHTPNKDTKAEAIRSASQLVYEMPDRDAVQFLYQNGLSNDRSEGGSMFGWSFGFGLSDGGVLILDISPEPVT